ncbi:hypothetical protein COCVIDRAFT_23839 [Bipolaris victoriae FI3]|uniref:Uncharacterized protein n=1 Tax=Bipolaris victoriae (strain FI3) TaxID=930091 RepID=W7EWN3_BIPV3|nr:hypothetical protein COCVIDRAFT_23839 [Bipolaris victoriae FI3]
MKSFRSKASRFFREGTTSKDKVATNSTSRFEFDAGIDSTATRKGRNSLFPTPPRVSPKPPVHTSQKLTKREVTWPFRRKDDKLERPQPALRLNSSSSTLLPPAIPRVIAREPSDDFDLLPDYDDSDDDDDDDDTRAFRRSPATSNKKKMYRNAFSMSNLKKSCSNLAALKSKSSRIFNGNKRTYSRSPPPPPVPQIPVDFTIPLPTRCSSLPQPPPPPPSQPPLPKRSSNRPPRPKLKKTKSSTGPISRPTPTSQDSAIPLLLNHLTTTTTPFTRRNRSPPQRPPRPTDSYNDTLMYMRHTNTRMVLPVRPRPNTTVSPSPSSPSPPSSLTASTARHASAIIASRLGIPTGHSTPSAASLSAPLAARIPPHPTLPLPVSISHASTRFTSRFSEFVAHCEPKVYGLLGARPGAGDAVEVYQKEMQDEWVLERLVSRGSGAEAGGMVFRDRKGGFHFVKNL